MKIDVSKGKTKKILRNICISTVILFLGIIIIFKSFNIKEEKQNLIYSYNISKNATYTVDLIENNYFNTQTLEMNKTYISSLVDKINMDFSYSLSGNKKAKTKYIYQIVAITNVKYADEVKNSDGTIWNKKETLIPPKEVEYEGASFSVKENVKIDFTKFNNEVAEFKKNLKIPIVATLQIKLVVRSDSKVPEVEDDVVEIGIMNLNLNLNEDVFTVEEEFKNAESKSITETIPGSKTVNKVSVLIGGVLVLSAIMIILDSIRKCIKFTQKSNYDIALNRILKNYGDIVAEVVSPIEIDNLNIIDVKNFDQLLDIEEEVRMPILFYETIEGEQGEFIIICDNMAYRYVIGQ